MIYHNICNYIQLWQPLIPSICKTSIFIKHVSAISYLKHFLDIFDLGNGLSYEKMAKSTPGYQIGEIKRLRQILSTKTPPGERLISEKQFSAIIKSGQIKELFVAREDISWEDIGGHDEVKEKFMTIMVRCPLSANDNDNPLIPPTERPDR